MPRPGPPDGGSEYPLVGPSEDVAGALVDFHLAYDGTPAALPLRLARLEGVGRYYEEGSSASRESAGSSFGRPEVLVLGGDDAVVLDTRTLPGHRTRAWGQYLIHEWYSDDVFASLAALPAADSGLAERVEPDSAVLDERTWRQPQRRVRRLIVDGHELSGRVTFLGGYNTTVGTASSDLTPADEPELAAAAVFESAPVFLSAAPGSGLGRYPDCDTDNPPIRRVNGVRPDERGNLVITGRDCVSVYRPVDEYRPPVPVEDGPHVLGWPDVALPPEATITVRDDCDPCCTCNDYERVALGMRRLWDQFKGIGQRLEAVRDDYLVMRDRMLALRDCLRNVPVSISAFASNGAVDIFAVFCSTSGDCKYGVKLDLTFAHSRGEVAEFSPEAYHASNPETGELLENDLPANHWPTLRHTWAYARPNQLLRVHVRLIFDVRSGDTLALTAQAYLSGTPLTPATKTVTLRR